MNMHKEKIAELIASYSKSLSDDCNRILESGFINSQDYEEREYILAKLVLSAAIERTKENFYPATVDRRAVVRRINSLLPA